MVDDKLVEEVVRRVLARLDERSKCEAGRPTAEGGGRDDVMHTGRVLTEWDVLTAHRSGRTRITLTKKTLVTPLARDRAKDLGVELVVGGSAA